MHLQWYSFDEKRPPEGVILLVYGQLGVDVAIVLEDQWYFKKGDDWSAANLEHWTYNTPTRWAKFNAPVEYSVNFTKNTFAHITEDLSEHYEDPDFTWATEPLCAGSGNLRNQ